jgi:hypothetical protein
MKKSRAVGIFKRQFTSVLENTTALSDIDDLELKEYLEGFYTEKDKDIVMYGALINSIFTHMAKTFLFSKRTLYNMVSSDVNITQDIRIHYGSYKRFLSRCISAGFIVRIKEPTRTKAGVYQLIEEEACKKLNEIQSLAFFKEQEEFVLSIYNKSAIFEEDNENKKSFADKIKDLKSKKGEIK